MSFWSKSNPPLRCQKPDVATLTEASIDGWYLYLTAEVFDGEHTHRFESIWPHDTTAREVEDYLKSISHKRTLLDPQIAVLLHKRVFCDK